MGARERLVGGVGKGPTLGVVGWMMCWAEESAGMIENRLRQSHTLCITFGQLGSYKHELIDRDSSTERLWFDMHASALTARRVLEGLTRAHTGEEAPSRDSLMHWPQTKDRYSEHRRPRQMRCHHGGKTTSASRAPDRQCNVGPTKASPANLPGP